MTDEQIEHIWDTHVGEPTNLLPMTLKDKLLFARAIERAIIAELSARQEPVAWLVLDRNGYVMHAASWEQAAHDHINDAINEHDLKEAADWIVRPCYTTPPLPEAPDTVRVPPGYRLLKDSTEADRSWLGDALHENGRYSCCCCECGRMFIGHKRRVVCRVCSLEKDTP